MADPYSDLIAAMIASKGGSDFSSNTMDPVMQYLNGSFQQAPQFDINQLYERTAPTFMSAASLGETSPHAIAAARIKSGQAPWELWRDKNLQQQSGMSPEEWKSFINDLAGEQQTVKKAMLDQSLQQDVFQKAGMRGANASYADMNPDGTQTYAPDAYQFAPKQFDELLANLPAELTSDAARRKSVEAKYGAPVMETDRDKILNMLYQESLGKRNAKEIEKVKGKRTYSLDPLTGKQVLTFDNPKRRGSGDDLSYVDGKSIDYFNKSGIFDEKNPDVASQMVRSLLGLKGSQWFGLKPLVDRVSTSIGVNNPRDQRAFAMADAQKLLKAQGSAAMENKRASAIGRSNANAINDYMDRKQGSGVNTQRQAAELAAQVLASLVQQGATPLKTDIMRNAMLKRSTKNG